MLKELKEQLEQAKSHGEKELPQWLREDDRFRLLLRMLEKRVRASQEAKGAARSALGAAPGCRDGRPELQTGPPNPGHTEECSQGLLFLSAEGSRHPFFNSQPGCRPSCCISMSVQGLLVTLPGDLICDGAHTWIE